MMYAVTYDLIERKDYSRIITAITRLNGARAALSVWFIDTAMSTVALRNHLATFLDEDDRLVIIPFARKPFMFNGFNEAAAMTARLPV